MYGIRSSDPIKFGTAVNQNSCEIDSLIPTSARFSTTIVHITHMQNPM